MKIENLTYDGDGVWSLTYDGNQYCLENDGCSSKVYVYVIDKVTNKCESADKQVSQQIMSQIDCDMFDQDREDEEHQ